ncbi:MAG: choice-of-anchor Q domain-containing protein [Sandaracinaceae bacterium]
MSPDHAVSGRERSPRSRFGGRGTWALTLSLALAFGCEGGSLVVVELRTDLVAGAELTGVEVTMDGETVGTYAPRAGDDFVTGVRVASIDDVTHGRHTFEVVVERGAQPALRRPVLVEVTQARSITIVISRDCADVDCSMSGERTACFAGTCVRPECTVESSEACVEGAVCMTSAECPPRDACAVARCESGACLYSSAGMCGPDTYCDPDRGCLPLSTPTDGGVDAGGIDAGPGSDAGPRDAGPPDAGPADAGPCVDADEDGFTTCAGDCDDADPFTHPGAVEVCGDGRVNDCVSATPDAICMGLGTFVARPPLGAPGNPGTRAAPVDTIVAGMNNATTIGGGVDVFVDLGTYPEDFAMRDGISVIGGMDSSDGWRFDPDDVTRRPVLAPPGNEGLTFPAGTGAATELVAFEVRGSSMGVVNLAVGFAATSSGVIRHCTLIGGTGSASSIVVAINRPGAPSSAVPVIEASRLRLGSGPASYGIKSISTSPRITDVDIELTGMSEDGYAIDLDSPVAASLDGVVITSVGGVYSRVVGIQEFGGSATITRAQVFVGRGALRSIGVRLGEAIETAYLTNSVIYGGIGPDTTAVQVDYENGFPATGPDIRIHSCTLDGGSQLLDSGRSIGLQLLDPTSGTARGYVRLLSSIVRAGTSDNRTCIAEDGPRLDIERLSANAYYVPPGGGESAIYLDEGTIPLDLGGANALPASVTPSIRNDCAMVDPRPSGDHHLTTTSMCIDRGTTEDMPATDLDEGPRPLGAGPDIGADELR